MLIGDALRGIKECKFGAYADIYEDDLFNVNKEEIVERAKDELIRGIAHGIANSSKLIINKLPQPNNMSGRYKTEFRAEVFVLTREEMEKLIINVEINTRNQVNYCKG